MEDQDRLENGLFALTNWVRDWTVRKEWRVEGDHSSPDALGRTFGDEIALMHSELSEGLEAFREQGFARTFEHKNGCEAMPEAGKGEDGCVCHPKPLGIASEFADELIRILDVCAHLRINLAEETILKMQYNETRAVRHGGKAL